MAQDLTRYTYWLAVLLTPGVGARLAAELLKRLAIFPYFIPLGFRLQRRDASICKSHDALRHLGYWPIG